VTTNALASCAALAASLAGMRASATFTGIIYRLGGSEKGRGADRKLYGDHLVHDTVVTGFKYHNLVKRDQALLLGVKMADLKAWAAGGYTAYDNPRRKDAVEVPVTLADFQTAMRELTESADRTLSGTNTSTSEHVYEPLVVDGSNVRGCKVYVGPTDPTKKAKAPVGTVYLSGLRVGRTVLEEAANGPVPHGKSGAVPTAKRIISAKLKLPSRRYVTYKLAAGPEAGWVLNVGGLAASAADAAGVTLDPALVESAKLALVG
jgi:hypothetical protein